MKTIRIIALVLAIVGVLSSVLGLLLTNKLNLYAKIGIAGNKTEDEDVQPSFKIADVLTTISLTLFSITLVCSLADVFVLAFGANSVAVLVFGIISIVGGVLTVGILMCVYYGLARKEKNKIQEENQEQEETQEQMA